MDTNTENNYQNQSGILYGIEYFILAPCEIRVNDLILCKNNFNGVRGPEIINHYLIKSGIQRVKIKVYHPEWKDGGVFTPAILKALLGNSYVESLEPNNKRKVTIIKRLEFPTIQNEVPFFEYEWEFFADVPYSTSSWDDAQDLLTMDRQVLEKEVFEKYQELWELLQSGRLNRFLEEFEDPNADLFASNFFDFNMVKDYKSNFINFFHHHKDAMLPIDDYDLVLLANGKAISLEQTGKFKGFGLLLGKGKIANSFLTNYVTLIKSKKTNKFKVQLVSSEYIDFH